MSFAFFYPKDIQIFIQKTIDFVENLEMTQIAAGGQREREKVKKKKSKKKFKKVSAKRYCFYFT